MQRVQDAGALGRRLPANRPQPTRAPREANPLRQGEQGLPPAARITNKPTRTCRTKSPPSSGAMNAAKMGSGGAAGPSRPCSGSSITSCAARPAAALSTPTRFSADSCACRSVHLQGRKVGQRLWACGWQGGVASSSGGSGGGRAGGGTHARGSCAGSAALGRRKKHGPAWWGGAAREWASQQVLQSASEGGARCEPRQRAPGQRATHLQPAGGRSAARGLRAGRRPA